MFIKAKTRNLCGVFRLIAKHFFTIPLEMAELYPEPIRFTSDETACTGIYLGDPHG